MTRSRALLILLCLLAVGPVGPPCLATQVRPLNLEDLTRKAGRIVAGRCARVEVLQDETLRRPVTRVTIQVDRSLKGGDGRSVVFRMYGDRSGRHRRSFTPGLPLFTPGEDLVLFLYPESAAGLTSPVGLGQGKFVVTPGGKQRGTVVVNGFGGRALFRGLSEKGRRRLGALTPRDPERTAIGRDALLEMVTRLLAPGEGP